MNNLTFEEKIREAITNKAFDRCLGCIDEAIKKIKKAAGEEFKGVVEEKPDDWDDWSVERQLGYKQLKTKILEVIEKL